MAATSLGRCCSLARSSLRTGAYLLRGLHAWRVRTSKSPWRACSRPYSQEPASGYRYAKSHEWASTGDAPLTTIGVSDYAQEKLGDVVFVELPEIGAKLEKDDLLGVLESVKAAADIITPVGGTVAEVNAALTENPELVNKDSYNEGWLVKLEGVEKEEVEEMMSVDDYNKFLEAEV